MSNIAISKDLLLNEASLDKAKQIFKNINKEQTLIVQVNKTIESILNDPAISKRAAVTFLKDFSGVKIKWLSIRRHFSIEAELFLNTYTISVERPQLYSESMPLDAKKYYYWEENEVKKITRIIQKVYEKRDVIERIKTFNPTMANDSEFIEIPNIIIERAESLINDNNLKDIPEAFPTHRGTVQLEWFLNSIDVEVEIFSHGYDIGIYYPTEKPSHETLWSQEDVIRKINTLRLNHEDI